MQRQESYSFLHLRNKTGRTLKTLEEELARRGYSTILSVSKRGLKPSKADFADVLSEIEKAVERVKTHRRIDPRRMIAR